MKKCLMCKNEIEDDVKFCHHCGAHSSNTAVEPTENDYVICNNCKTIINDTDATFCPNCGAKVAKSSIQDSLKKATQKVNDNEFVQSVKQDVGSSQTLNMIKNKTKSLFNKANSMNKSKKIIAAVVAVLLVVLIVATNIHRCEDCEELYFGKKYTVNFLGEEEDLCKDCYDHFWDIDW